MKQPGWKKKQKKHIPQGARHPLCCLGPLLIIFPLHRRMVSFMLVVDTYILRLSKKNDKQKRKKQTYQGGPNDVSFGPTAHHLFPPSRHGVRSHGGGSYIYDLVKQITNEKEKIYIKGRDKQGSGQTPRVTGTGAGRPGNTPDPCIPNPCIPDLCIPNLWIPDLCIPESVTRPVHTCQHIYLE